MEYNYASNNSCDHTKCALHLIINALKYFHNALYIKACVTARFRCNEQFQPKKSSTECITTADTIQAALVKACTELKTSI